jgi:biotin operon repressor
MKKKQCADCDKQLMKDEVAISKKMLGRSIVDFFCLDCLATELDCEREDLEIKIQEFREQGCSLFL